MKSWLLAFDDWLKGVRLKIWGILDALVTGVCLLMSLAYYFACCVWDVWSDND